MDGRGNIHTGHRERMRKRFIEQGNADGFEDHEMLEMLLYYAVKRSDTNALAHKMIDSFGSFHALLDASVPEIMESCGVSEATAFLVSLMPYIARRYGGSANGQKSRIGSKNDAFDIIQPMITDHASEQFFVVCLDEGYNVIKLKRLAQGTATSTEVRLEAIISMVIKHKAAYAIIAHNHPGHTYGPSGDDIAATEKIKSAFAIINVVLLDHIIICGDKCFSFAQNRICGLHY